VTPRDTRRLRAVADETVRVTAAGSYTTATGRDVDISAAVAAAVAGTRLYLPGAELAPQGAANTDPVMDVVNTTTLEAGRSLGPGAAALVFASARNPGGGFLRGTVAQEEDIARASAIYACLMSVPDFYEHHRGEKDLRYSDRVIYSPGVPVFRDDSLRLLEEPYGLSMITAAAPNLRAIRVNQPERASTVPEVLRRRAMRVLEIAAAHGHRRLVLGAWGCGVFGNDAGTVADAFARGLRELDRFDRVVFAVLDRAPGTPTHGAFARRFSGR
jgi:uncharacterized protein (TIGR02452 family)